MHPFICACVYPLNPFPRSPPAAVWSLKNIKFSCGILAGEISVNCLLHYGFWGSHQEVIRFPEVEVKQGECGEGLLDSWQLDSPGVHVDTFTSWCGAV